LIIDADVPDRALQMSYPPASFALLGIPRRLDHANDNPPAFHHSLLRRALGASPRSGVPRRRFGPVIGGRRTGAGLLRVDRSKWTIGGSALRPAYAGLFSAHVDSGFSRTLSIHPEALAQAQSAAMWHTPMFVGLAGLVIGGAVALTQTIKEASALQSGTSSGDPTKGYVISISSGILAIISGLESRHHMSSAVSAFNEGR
jgi:hypothetical protein